VPFPSTRRGFFASVFLLAQVLVYYGVSRAEVIPSIRPWTKFPDQIGAWRGEDTPADEESLDRLHPDDYLNRLYSTGKPGQSCAMFIAYFKTQRDGRAPHSPQNCLPGTGWQSMSNRIRSFSVPGSSEQVLINEYTVQKESDTLVVHYWFQQNRRVFSDEIKAQFYAMPELLMHGRTDIALVRIITPVTSTPEAAEENGLNFSSTVFPTVREWLH
jgi:EpsI family protein